MPDSRWPASRLRRRTLFGSLALALALAWPARRAVAAPAWQSRLRGDTIALLGEVHDNPIQHRLRLQALRDAVDAGWRPVLVMEQFDRDRQPAIDRARRERPNDARHLIEAGAPPGTPSASGWNWDYYRPVVELALQHELPLIAGNLSSGDTTRIVREGFGSVFDPPMLAALGLDRAIASDWQAAQEREIDAGHCHALPPSLWPKMARAQFARDAVMAHSLRAQRSRGVVLLAGNGHVRRDLGVPRWLDGDAARAVAVGFLEQGDATTPPAAFDAVVRTPAAERDDPCAGFLATHPPKTGG